MALRRKARGIFLARPAGAASGGLPEFFYGDRVRAVPSYFCMPLPLLLPVPVPMPELPAPVVLEGLLTQVCWPLMAFSQDAIV